MRNSKFLIIIKIGYNTSVLYCKILIKCTLKIKDVVLSITNNDFSPAIPTMLQGSHLASEMDHTVHHLHLHSHHYQQTEFLSLSKLCSGANNTKIDVSAIDRVLLFCTIKLEGYQNTGEKHTFPVRILTCESVYSELPPSMIMSPFSNKGTCLHQDTSSSC